jgi:hypothetical protein
MARRSNRARMTRRAVLGGMAAGASAPLWLPKLRAAGDDPRFLIVLGCFGGASALDCFLPVDNQRAFTDPNRGTVISYPTLRVGNIRTVNRTTPVNFLANHGHDCMVMGVQNSSVNHFVAQNRAVTGRDAWAGRTLAEAVASVHGTERVLPNVNMGRGGYALPGSDPTLDARFRAEVVSNPVTFPLVTHSTDGIILEGDTPAQDTLQRREFIRRTRAMRDGTLEGLSPFGQTFANSQRRQELLYARANSDARLETADLIQQLLFVEEISGVLPWSDYGLTPNEEADRITDVLYGAFPNDTSGNPEDRLHAQAALAYLLLRTGTSSAVTLTEPGTDGFLAFDNSHVGHMDAQEDHWDRVLDTTSRLIGLLETAEYVDAGGPTGTSLWDRTMIVFATEFGRDKWDTGGSFGTGHHLNNGLLVVSPLIRGDQSLGEADPNNGFICGFEPDTGEPTPFDDLTPGEDPLFSDSRLPPQAEAVYGTLLDALGVSYEGQEILSVVKG